MAINYTGGNIVLSNTGREINIGERIACNCCGGPGTVVECEMGNHVLRYCIDWDGGQRQWVATNTITPVSELDLKYCLVCGRSHVPAASTSRSQRAISEYTAPTIRAKAGSVLIAASEHGMGFTCVIDGQPVKLLRSVSLRLELDKPNIVTLEVLCDHRGT